MSEEYYSKSEADVQPHVTGTAQPGVDDTPHDQAHDEAQLILTGGKSPGVARIEAINRHLTIYDRIALFIGVFLIGYAYGLDATVRYSYQVIRYAKLSLYQLHTLTLA